MFYKELYEKTDGYGSNVYNKIMNIYFCKKKNIKIKVPDTISIKNKLFDNFINFKALDENITKDDKPIITNIKFDIDDYYNGTIYNTMRSIVNDKPYNLTTSGKINIGVHIRRGDIFYRSCKDSSYREKYYKNTKKQGYRPTLSRRFIKISDFISVMKKLNVIFTEERVIFHIFSTGDISEFTELDAIKNKVLYIDNPIHQEIYHKMRMEDDIKKLISTLINCDVLICSKSTLSLTCALLTKSIVINSTWNLSIPTNRTYSKNWYKFYEVDKIKNDKRFEKILNK